MSDVVDHLMSKLDIHPVLIDVGASYGMPKIWDKIARQSIYVGFDPDLRAIREVSNSRFYRQVIFNEAVTYEDKKETLFYLTRSPACSSILEPDTESLSNYLHADLFVVEKQVSVKATRLNAVADYLSLACFDWLKTDSQGIDLRVFISLKEELRSRVLALDIEPGLIDGYRGEDLFVDVHRCLTQEGFWLSSLEVKGAARMRKATLHHVLAQEKGMKSAHIERSIRPSPGWVEGRYLKSVEWMRRNNFSKREYALLWVFAMLDSQFGFALDLVVEWEKIFGSDDLSALMRKETISSIRRSHRYWNARARDLVPSSLKRAFRNLMNAATRTV